MNDSNSRNNNLYGFKSSQMDMRGCVWMGESFLRNDKWQTQPSHPCMIHPIPSLHDPSHPCMTHPTPTWPTPALHDPYYPPHPTPGTFLGTKEPFFMAALLCLPFSRQKYHGKWEETWKNEFQLLLICFSFLNVAEWCCEEILFFRP